jgi:hypothetical protein
MILPKKSSLIRRTLERLEERWVPAGDAVLRWNDLALDATKLDHAVGGSAHHPGPTKAARSLAIVHAAMYDAANSITNAYQPYRFSVSAPFGASVSAAVAAAGRDTLTAMYPSMQATFDAALAQDLAAIPTVPAQQGAAIGHQIAALLLALRENDGSELNPPYTVNPNPGHWSPDPLHPTQEPYGVGSGLVLPFAIQSGSQFRPTPPPPLTSPEYTAAYQELLALGGDGTTTPTSRTVEQTEIGIYWGYDGQPGLCSPPRLYNQIAVQIAEERQNTEMQNARYLCLVNLAICDAATASWEAKYFYDFWRPVTAIRRGAEDGNPDTPGIPTWSPLGAPASNGGGTNFTPPFPAYTSGHATLGAAAFKTIERFYGTDRIPFTFVSDEFNGLTFDMNGQIRPVRPRHFETLSQAAEENGQSRIYLGIHWKFDKVKGIEQGTAIANYIFDNTLRAKPEVRRMAIGADLGGGPHVRVLETATGRFVSDFFAYDAAFRGGVRVAMGDVNRDGHPDIITAAGPGGGPHVKVFDGVTHQMLASFMAYDIQFSGGVTVASGDVDGDGFDDIITGADSGGGPHVRVFSGNGGHSLLNFFAYDGAFRGGVRVSSGDVNGDGLDDIITGAGAGGASHVRVFSGAGAASLSSFFAYDTAFTGGVFVAAGDADGDGKADIFTGAGVGGGPHAQVFKANGTRIQSFIASLTGFNGVHIGATDVDGDGRADLLSAATQGNAPVVDARDSVSLNSLGAPFVYDPSFLGGVFVGGVL